jgi:hypothetical protein
LLNDVKNQHDEAIKMCSTLASQFTRFEVVLAVALELAKASWKVALQDGCRDRSSVHSVNHVDPVKRLDEAVALIVATKISGSCLRTSAW